MTVECFWRGRDWSFGFGFFSILYIILLSISMGTVAADVVVIGNNFSLSFKDIEANFAPKIKGSGIFGTLNLAEPLEACSPLINKAVPAEGVHSSFVLIARGGCNFDDKVRSAQYSGYKAAIIFDDKDGALVSMAGNPEGLKIHAMFVSKIAGEISKAYADLPYVEVWIIPTLENSAWSIMVIAFILLLAMSAVLATCFFVGRHRIRRHRHRAHVQEYRGMSNRLVKAMSSVVFTSASEDNCTSSTCAICLEDYCVGDKLRILPCCHKFHAMCVDSWLTTWRTFCPVCKRDARMRNSLPASECTPLLSSAPSPSSSALPSLHFSSNLSTSISISSSCPFSSRPSLVTSYSTMRSAPMSVPSYSTMRSAPMSVPSPSRCIFHPVSASSYLSQSLTSYGNSPAISGSRCSAPHLSPASSNCSNTHLISPLSLGHHPLTSSFNSQHSSPFIPFSSNASPHYLIGSSQSFLQQCSNSVASISPLASSHSLPAC